ncbi:hypothetical protein DOE59_16500 [Salmonella enterica subsp. diarizonae serovar 48:i:z]|uniref:Uncharacterized protein n=1 Tax=Salmonella enterica subsp. diarizonae serovar 48:i:z TaxID=1192842 RepID=A0A7U5YHI0_SALDZ|nr:hypothetical protein [Salmonella enterica]EAW1261864.1 hypothetical protein [Salmonella enterica subsp. diarizonae]AXC73024.1 hypothetical protein DOE59_16500 [Salmonella enterica subsp. diarizonae serovar 48:i:z]EAT1856551.1 hypothetical protein [Salmonella enterica]EEG1121507.1 hypothetical protein [Salmonella enterica subsp. diarizonae]EGU4505150.1 hypothetical protein [Salmonella enterica]
MKNIIVTISDLYELKKGVMSAGSVAFKVVQGGKVLIEDTLHGNVSGDYKKRYPVNCDAGPLFVQHNNPEKNFKITASVM